MKLQRNLIATVFLGVMSSLIALSVSYGSSQKDVSRAKPGVRGAAASERMSWFNEAKFGMFIHWGLYAIPARGEWVQFGQNIPGPEYEKYAAQFNPVKFNAREWVTLAKDAGMRYLVITAKHHDGFCLWDTKLTDYNVVKATPFRRDPLKELAEECNRQGIKFGVYYSVQDWHYPDYPTLYTRRTKEHPDGYHGFPKPNADYMKYLDYMQGQLKELMTNYGPIYELFFDWYSPDAYHNEAERKRGQEIVNMVHKLQPNCAINDRLAGIGADYATHEQQIPGGGDGAASAFEVNMTLGRSWGYSRNERFKDARTVIRNLCDIAGKGGNYLLNVGPSELGVISDEEGRILREVGQWLKVNGEAIYGTAGGPNMRWEEGIKMVTRRPGKEYLHVINWPKDQKVFYFRFLHRLKKAYFLADPSQAALKVDLYRRSLMIHVPPAAPDPINSIIVLEYGE